MSTKPMPHSSEAECSLEARLADILERARRGGVTGHELKKLIMGLYLRDYVTSFAAAWLILRLGLKHV